MKREQDLCLTAHPQITKTSKSRKREAEHKTWHDHEQRDFSEELAAVHILQRELQQHHLRFVTDLNLGGLADLGGSGTGVGLAL